MSRIAIPIWTCTAIGKGLFSLILIAVTGMEPGKEHFTSRVDFNSEKGEPVFMYNLK